MLPKSNYIAKHDNFSSKFQHSFRIFRTTMSQAPKDSFVLKATILKYCHNSDSFQLYQRILKFKFKRSHIILWIKPNWSAYLILLFRSVQDLNFKINYSNNHWQKNILYYFDGSSITNLSRGLQKLSNLRFTNTGIEAELISLGVQF